MFYYYGSKARLAPAYPIPRYPLVVEPFAGAAAYAVRSLCDRYAEEALLVDRDPRVVEMWERLIAMTPAQVLALPDLVPGDRTTDPLHMTIATSNAWGTLKRLTVTTRMAGAWPKMRANIAYALPYVAGRVTIRHGDYQTAREAGEATYFVDPPYQTLVAGGARGAGYAPGCNAAALDFATLGAWCLNLPGQVIATEQDGADWLPFHPLRRHSDSVGGRSVEVVWYSDGEELSLF